MTRSGEIGKDSALTGVGQIGNSITAITGSTFGTGQFNIEVQDVQAAQQRKVESTIAFRDTNGAVLGRTASLVSGTGGKNIVLNGTFVGGVYTGGTTMQDGDTITLTGTNADGTTFEESLPSPQMQTLIPLLMISSSTTFRVSYQNSTTVLGIMVILLLLQ